MNVSGLEVIDCHIHPFLNAAHNFCMFPGIVNSPEEFFAELHRSGITRSCGSVVRSLSAPTFEQIAELNREAMELAERFPEYLPGLNVHGKYPEESCREIETLAKTGKIVWIGELVGYIMDYPSYATPEMYQIYELAQHLDLPVNIHPYGLDEIAKVCENFPRLKVVVAHPGSGRNDILTRFEFMVKHENAYLDLSGSGVFRWGMLRHGINMAGSHKFLFGTDFPLCNPALILEGVRFEHLTDDELAAVCSGNFKRLTGIK